MGEAQSAIASVQASAHVSHQTLEERNERRRVTLLRKIEKAEAELDKRRSRHAEIAAKLNAAHEKVAERTKYNERVVSETKKLEALEQKSEFQEHLQALRGMVQLNEKYKSQEKTFKENCAAHMKELKAELDSMQNKDPTEETERLDEIERMYDA